MNSFNTFISKLQVILKFKQSWKKKTFKTRILELSKKLGQNVKLNIVTFSIVYMKKLAVSNNC